MFPHCHTPTHNAARCCHYTCSERTPTVSALHGEAGFAVQVLVVKKESAKLIPQLRDAGASAIVITEVRQYIE